MDRNPISGELLSRAAGELLFGQGREAAGAYSSHQQNIPLNVFESEEEVVLVCPMPGVEADNIDIEILGSTVTLRASLRGPGQANRNYLLHEWSYGPYARTVTLPMEIDAAKAHASHGNGVLVLTLPKTPRAQTVRVPLRKRSARPRAGS